MALDHVVAARRGTELRTTYDGCSSLRSDDSSDPELRDGATSDEAQVSGDACPPPLIGGEELAPMAPSVGCKREEAQELQRRGVERGR